MARGLQVPVVADTSGLEKGLMRSSAAVAAWSAGTGKLLGSSLGGISLAFGAAGVAAGLFTKTAIDSFTTLDHMARNTAGIILGATSDTIKAVQDDLVDLALEYSHSLDDVGRGYYQAISSSISQEHAKEFMDIAAQVAIAGSATIEDATNAMITAVKGTGAAVEEWPQIANWILGAVREGRVTVTELSATMADYAILGSMANVGLEEQLAAHATLTRIGFSAEESATYLKRMMIELSEQGTMGFDVFRAAAGQTFEEFMAGGGDLIEGLQLMWQRADEFGYDAAEVFQNIRGGLASAGLRKDLEGYLDDLNKLRNEPGALEDAFKIHTEGVTYQLARLHTAFDVAGAKIGQFFEPLLQKFVPNITDAIEKSIVLRDEWVDEQSVKFAERMAGYWTDFREDVDAIWPKIKTLARTVWNLVDGPLAMVGRFIRDYWRPFIEMLVDAAHHVIQLGHRVVGFVRDNLAPFNNWKADTWDPWIEQLQADWELAIAIKEGKVDDNAQKIIDGTRIPTLTNVVIDIALSEQSPTILTGALLAIGGLLSGNPALGFTGLALIGAGTYTYLQNQEWFKKWLDDTVKPHLDGPIKKITGYGLALFGMIGGNRDWVKDGLTRAGFTPAEGEVNDKWIDEWVGKAKDWVEKVSKFVGYGLLVFGILRLNPAAISAAIPLSQVDHFNASEDKGAWIATAIENIITAATNFAKVAGLTMMLGGAMTRNLGMIKTGAKVAAYGFAPEAIAGAGWITENIDKVIELTDKYAKPVGLAIMMLAAWRMNWKGAALGYGLYKTGGDLGDDGDGDLFDYSTIDDWAPLAIAAGLQIATLGSRSGNLAVVGIGLGVATAGGFLWADHYMPKPSETGDKAEETLVDAGVDPIVAKMTGNIVEQEQRFFTDLVTGGTPNAFGGVFDQLRDWAGGWLPWRTKHTGGPIMEDGWYNLEAGEHVLTARQKQSMMGGVTVKVYAQGWNYADERAFLSTMNKVQRRQGSDRAQEALGIA